MSSATSADQAMPSVGFTRLKSNLYSANSTAGRLLKTTTVYEASPQVCGCKPHAEGGTSCASNCSNRDGHIECHQVFCICGKACQNQRIRQGQHAKTLVFDAGNKGQGLKAAEDITPGSLVVEYIGELISPDKAEERCGRYEEQGIKHLYFLQTRCGALIDATMKGNEARFINHSCEPNCQAEYWTVEGRERVGIFAINLICEGQEITYDYHAVSADEPVIR
ncbi:Histone-lysine N-methyltransferase setd2 [Trebouxia sp. C0009 RCD-2024]